MHEMHNHDDCSRLTCAHLLFLLQESIFCHAKCSIRELGAGNDMSFMNRYECCACERSLYMNPSESSVPRVQAYHACMPHTGMCSYVSHFETRACSADTFVGWFDCRSQVVGSASAVNGHPDAAHSPKCTVCKRYVSTTRMLSTASACSYACTTGCKLTLAFGQWLELRSAIPGVTSEENVHQISPSPRMHTVCSPCD